MKRIQLFVLVITLIAAILVPTSVSVASQLELVETVIVPANSISPTSSTNVLQNGATYVLKVSGTWRDTSQPDHYIDAEYTTFDGWTTYMDGTPNWGPQQKDLLVDNAFVDWGDYNPAHEYELSYTGTGASINFWVIDKDPSNPIDPAWYADNVGSLTVEIYRYNSEPVACDQSVTTDEDTPVLITLQAGDADGDPLSYIIAAAPLHGNLSGTAPSITYTPIGNYNGPDNFSFKVNDGRADSNTATVSIAVVAVNDPPILSPIGNMVIDEGQTLLFSVSASDPDSNVLIYTVSNLPFGAFFNPVTKTFCWTPGYFQAGNYQVTFSVSDSLLTDSEDIIITVNNVIITATIDIDPDTLNLKSHSDKNALTAYIELPAGYKVRQINIASIRLNVNGVLISAQLFPTAIGDYDRDRIPDLMVKFNREKVIKALGNTTGYVTLTVTGFLYNGCEFSGEDTIKIIKSSK